MAEHLQREQEASEKSEPTPVPSLALQHQTDRRSAQNPSSCLSHWTERFNPFYDTDAPKTEAMTSSS